MDATLAVSFAKWTCERWAFFAVLQSLAPSERRLAFAFEKRIHKRFRFEFLEVFGALADADVANG